MRICILFLIVFALFRQQVISADWTDYYKNSDFNSISNDLVIYNALNLNETQNSCLNSGEKKFCKALKRKQKAKYSMIKRLERQNKKRPRNPQKYYKTNPQLFPFGDYKTIEKCDN